MIDRRTFLQGSLSAAVIAALAERGIFAAQPGAAFGPAAVRALDPAPPGSRTPYSLATSSVLSEDYFMTASVPIDPTADSVGPFVNLNGDVEALVVSGGVLSHLARDSTQPSGWSFGAVPGMPGNTLPDGSMVAAVWDTVSFPLPVLMAIVVPPPQANSAPLSYVVSFDSVNGWQCQVDTSTVTSASVVSLRAMHAQDGSGYIYAVGDDGVISAWGGEISSGGPLITQFQGQITDALLLYGGTSPTPSLGVLGLNTDGNAYWYPWTGTSYGAGVNQGAATELIWAGFGSTPNGPDFVFRFGSILEGFIAFESVLGDLTAPEVQEAVVWSEAAQPSFAVLAEGAVIILSGLDGLSVTPGVTIETGFAAMYGISDVATLPTLFVVDSAFGLLSVLTKDAATSAWSLTPVMLPSSEALDITNWRTQLTVLDVNGAPVSGVEVSVSTDSTVGVWQASGNVVLGPTTPQTFTTDQHGMVTLALAALDLQPPAITAQVSGGSATSYTPGADVHAFLGGTAPLNGMPAITPTDPSALLGNGPDGQPLTNLSGTAPAAAVASALNQTMVAANGPAPQTGDIQSYKLDLTGADPVYSSSQDPNSPSTAPDVVYLTPSGSAGEWWDKVKADFHTVEHAIRKGVISVEQYTAKWVAATENAAAAWVITLGVAVTDDLKDIAVFVVDSLESAITAIHGVFNAIALDVERAVQWLRMALSDLFQEVESNTQVLLGWLNQLPVTLAGLIPSIPDLTNGYFLDKQTDITNRLGTLYTTTQGAGWTLDNVSGSSAGELGGFDPATILTDVRHNWLLDKIVHAFDEALQPAGSDSALGSVASDLIDAVTALVALIGEIADDIANTIYDALSNASDLKTMGMSILVEMLEKITVNVLTFADTVISKLLDAVNAAITSFANVLTTPVPGLTLLAAVLSKFGVHVDTSAGHVYGLMLMFPATLAHRLAEDGAPLFPSADSASAASVDWAKALGYMHGTARMLQGLSDVVADVWVLSDGELDTRPLKWTALADAIWGAALQTVVWPGAKNPDGTTAAPFSTSMADPTVGNLGIWKYSLGFLGPLLGTVFTLGAWNGTKSYSSWAPYLVAGNYAAAFGLGLAAEIEKNASVTTAIISALEVLPRVVAPLATLALNEDNDGAALIIKIVTDAMETIAGAAIVGEAIVAP